MPENNPGLRDTSYCPEPLRPYFTRVFNKHLEAWQQAPKKINKGAKKLTQKDFCDLIDYRLDTLRNWRSGESLPGRAALPAIYEAFGTTHENFMNEVNILFLRENLLNQLLSNRRKVIYPDFPNSPAVIRATWQYLRTIFGLSMSGFPLRGWVSIPELDKDGYYQWNNGPTYPDPLPEGVNIPSDQDFKDFYAVIDPKGFIHELSGYDFEFLADLSEEIYKYVNLRLHERKQILEDMLLEGDDKNKVSASRSDLSTEYKQKYGNLDGIDWDEIENRVAAKHISYVVRDEDRKLRAYKSDLSDK